MGADLYINKLFQANQAKYEPIFQRWVAVRQSLEMSLPASLQQGQYKAKGIQLTPDQKIIVEKIKWAQKKVSYIYDKMYSVGYFRDSYNSTSILNRLGLSWWQDVSGKLTNKKGDMTPTKAKIFLAQLKAAKLDPVTAKSLKAEHCTVDDNENSPEAWNKMFKRKRARLIRFVEIAIKLKTPIKCSC